MNAWISQPFYLVRFSKKLKGHDYLYGEIWIPSDVGSMTLGKGMMLLDSIICYLCYFYVTPSTLIVNRERVSFYFIVFGLILFFNPILKNRREKQSRFFDLFRHSFVFKKMLHNR